MPLNIFLSSLVFEIWKMNGKKNEIFENRVIFFFLNFAFLLIYHEKWAQKCPFFLLFRKSKSQQIRLFCLKLLEIDTSHEITLAKCSCYRLYGTIWMNSCTSFQVNLSMFREVMVQNVPKIGPKISQYQGFFLIKLININIFGSFF